MHSAAMTCWSFLCLALAPIAAQAAQNAITDTGRQVILNDDGTWRYVAPPDDPDSVDVSEQEFTRPADASFKLKSKVNDSVFWLDPTEWTFQNGVEDKEYEFELKSGDVYGMAITERIRFDLDAMMNIGLEIARQAAPDLEVNRREYRVVNGEKVGFMRFTARTGGAEFAFLGYYYAGPSGSTQLLVWTGLNLLDRYERTMQDLLNGLAVE